MTDAILDPANFINYGVLGAWTLYLIYEKKILLKALTTSLDRLSDTIHRAMEDQ